MAASSLSLSSPLTTLSNKFHAPHSSNSTQASFGSSCNGLSTSNDMIVVDDGSSIRRRLLLLGAGGFTSNLFHASPLFAQGVPKSFREYVDSEDGYSYYYPSDWVDFDFLGHDSAFKDRYLQLQNVRVRFIPTDKKDIHDLGERDEVIYQLVAHRYAAPNQRATILDMQERTVDGKSYYTVEFELTSVNFSSNSFATIAIANGRYYTLIVGANARRWKRVRDQLKVVADSFKVLEI